MLFQNYIKTWTSSRKIIVLWVNEALGIIWQYNMATSKAFYNRKQLHGKLYCPFTKLCHLYVSAADYKDVLFFTFFHAVQFFVWWTTKKVKWAYLCIAIIRCCNQWAWCRESKSEAIYFFRINAFHIFLRLTYFT